MQKSYQAKPQEVPREWLLVDLEDKTLGRAATAIATFLRGKHKPQFTPHVDAGDFVVVVNADKVQLTGRKLQAKLYHRHTLYPGGLNTITAKRLLATKPEEVIRMAVKGMLPKNALGRKLMKKLKIYASADHPHEAQQPTRVEI